MHGRLYFFLNDSSSFLRYVDRLIDRCCVGGNVTKKCLNNDNNPIILYKNQDHSKTFNGRLIMGLSTWFQLPSFWAKVNVSSAVATPLYLVYTRVHWIQSVRQTDRVESRTLEGSCEQQRQVMKSTKHGLQIARQSGISVKEQLWAFSSFQLKWLSLDGPIHII